MEQTFKFTDHVHFERHAPDQTTDIYYDATEEFKQRFEAFYADYEQKAADVATTNEYLIGLGKAIDEEFGPLTIDQLLLIVHVFGGQLGQRHGYMIGYQRGAQAVIDQMNKQNQPPPAALKQSGWGTNQGMS